MFCDMSISMIVNSLNCTIFDAVTFVRFDTVIGTNSIFGVGSFSQGSTLTVPACPRQLKVEHG